MTSNEDLDLIRRIVSGDEQALALLHSRYERQILNFINRMVGNRDMAQELTSDVFFRVWRKAALYDPTRGAFSTWLYQVAGNVTRNRLDSHARRVPAEPLAADERLPAPDALPDDALVREEERQRLRGAMLELKHKDRMILVLRHFEERTTDEIATIVGVPAGTVKSRVHYALQRLKRALLPTQDEPL